MVLTVGTDCAGVHSALVALQVLGVPYRLVFSSEMDKTARAVGDRWCGPPEQLSLDMRTWDVDALPSVDLYVCGFVCVAFSAMGRRGGLQDVAKGGDLFHYVLRYVSRRRPGRFVLENVQGLTTHDGGRTFAWMLEQLRAAGGGCYHVSHKVLNARDYGVPHNRPRVFLVGVRRDLAPAPFEFPPPLPAVPLASILQPSAEIGDAEVAEAQPTEADRRNAIAQAALVRAKGQGNMFAETYVVNVHASKQRMFPRKGSAPCLLTQGRYYVTNLCGRSSDDLGGRLLTRRELLRLQGFPDTVDLDDVSLRQATRLMGNTICCKVLQAILRALLPVAP